MGKGGKQKDREREIQVQELIMRGHYIRYSYNREKENHLGNKGKF
jgi:hypothetical protein